MTYDPDVPDEVRAAFAAGPGAEPPLTLAVDDVLTAGRAVRRKRRGTLTAVASGLSVVAVVTAVTIGTLGAGPGTTPLADGTGDGPVPCTTELPPRPPVEPPVEVTPRPTVSPEPSVGPEPTIPVTPEPSVGPEPTIPVTPEGSVAVTPVPTYGIAPATPTPRPTGVPVPTPVPTDTAAPTTVPTAAPTPVPTATAAPTAAPSPVPTCTPAAPVTPTAAPSDLPTPTVTPTERPPSPGPSSTPAAPETQAEQLARLTARLKQAVPLPPGGRFVRSTDAPAGYGTFAAYPAESGYEARADVHDPLGRGSIEVTIRAAGEVPAGDICAGLDHCTSFRTPQGDLVVVHRRVEGSGTVLMVQAYRTDGTAVFVAVTDFAQNGRAPNTSPLPPRSQRPGLAWTQAQLTAVVLTPGLHVD